MEVEYTPEQVKALEEKAKLADELEAKLKEAEGNVTSTVEELKELRKKKQELEDIAKAALESKNQDGDPVAKTREIVESILNEEKSKQIEMTRTEFEAQFKAANPEFLPENDPAGIKFQAFKETLSKFNTSSAKDIKSLSSLYSDAYMLMNKRSAAPIKGSSQDAFSPVSGGRVNAVVDGELTPQEQKLITSSGWTKEKYLKLKSNQPRFINQLLSQVQD